MRGEYNDPFSSDEWQQLAMPYKEFDVSIDDINEDELVTIGRTYEIENLSAAEFPSSAFPVKGHFIIDRNKRFMVPLVCQWAGKPHMTSINVWFLVDTGSPFTTLTMKSLKAILGANKEIYETDCFEIAIQDQQSNVSCQVSKAHFKEVNILGANAVQHLKLWLRGNWNQNEFELYRQ
ncbi:hypothetical protein M3Y94_00098400 [Aphelenchoides besseyi]|nr:hypothetical protein M3Y94_00098400 [Aphelenchoides besseyi]KAI6237625.1 hypothetical protein M3Y95_00285200 [Aphelenchoides besseyi]